MLQRSCLLSVIMAAACTTAAVADGDEARPNDLPGWGRVLDPWRDCDVSLDGERDRLKIRVPGTPHVLSAEDASSPMNAPRVVRRVRGDFTASRPRARPARAGAVEDDALRPLPRRRPDRLAGPVELPPARTGRRVRSTGGLIPTSITSCVRAVAWPCRTGSRSKTVPSSSSSGGKAGRSLPGTAATAANGSSWAGRRDPGRTGRGRRRRRQLFRTDAVGRAGDVQHRGSARIDGSGRRGPGPGRIAAPSSGLDRQSAGASEAIRGSGAGRALSPSSGIAPRASGIARRCRGASEAEIGALRPGAGWNRSSSPPKPSRTGPTGFHW